MTLHSSVTHSRGHPKWIERPNSGHKIRQGRIGFISAFALVVIVLLVSKATGNWRDVLFVAGAAACFSIALHNFALAWAVILLLLPFIHFVASMFGSPRVSLLRILLVGMACLLFFGRRRANSWQVLLRQFGFFAFLLFILANLISAIRLLQIEAVFRSMTYLEPALFYVLTYYVVRRDPRNLRRVLYVLVISGIFVGVLGLVEMIEQKPVFDLLGITVTGLQGDFGGYLSLNRFGLGGRIIATIGQPVYAGAYFSIWLIISVYYVVVYRPKYRRLLFILIPLGTVLILGTGSVGPLIALAFTLLAFVVFNPKKGRAIMIAGGGAALVATFVSLFLPNLFSYVRAALSVTSGTQESANFAGRIELTTVLLGIFQQNPVFGYGPGLIQKAALQQVSEFARLGGLENQYAMILADGGLLAGLAYLLFMVGTVWSLLRIRQSRNREVAYGGFVTLLIFAFYFVFAVGANCITLLPNMLVMSVYGAVVASYDNERASGGKHELVSPSGIEGERR